MLHVRDSLWSCQVPTGCVGGWGACVCACVSVFVCVRQCGFTILSVAGSLTSRILRARALSLSVFTLGQSGPSGVEDADEAAKKKVIPVVRYEAEL